MSTVRYVRKGSKQVSENRQDHKAWQGLVHKALTNGLAPSAFKRKRFKPLDLIGFIKLRLREPWVELIWVGETCIYDQRIGLLVPEGSWK